ncbi:unnamed protein product [Medioppia subpectinata]|uniref:Solute carrier family 35 member B1 n=1 Tax=Medioppia subpectinata TaxID=1979941 RepID=A0A7R9PW37_9ACAR|nr:unnamed protein product [Medioppia subpectinata]CAG2102907.1 unnamed protein product [Medioppia subpectinata]
MLTQTLALNEPLIKHQINAQYISINTIKANTAVMDKKLMVYALGIFVTYFYFGILQEKITRSKYGDNKETFKCTISLVFIQCLVNALFAKLMVGKSCKPIPVMILGVLFGRKRYPILKYLFVFMIVVGVGLFMFKDNAGRSSAASATALGTGELLLILSLAMDGLTGAFQERMKNEYKTQSGHMMLQMNIWSTLTLGLILLIFGEIWTFIEFVGRYPYVIYDIISFSVLSAVGQMFIFLIVANFGPLPCSITTTTRKFFTVLGSVILFGNSLSNRQWLGTAFVFLGLALDSFYGKTSVKAKPVK